MGAEVLIAGPSAKRWKSIEEFMTGVFETDLQPGERCSRRCASPRLSRRARWGYHKLCRKTGEFAHAIGVVLHDPERSVSRVVLGATESRPIVEDAHRLVADGQRLDVEAARQLLVGAAGYRPSRTTVHLAALKRAVERAQQP